MFELIKQFEPSMTDSDMKKTLLTISHGGKAPLFGPLAEYQRQLCTAAMELSTIHPYDEMYEGANQENRLGSFISRTWQVPENKVCMAIVDFFVDKGVRVGAPVFDGVLVEKHENPDIAGAEAAVLKKQVFV